jgi:protein-S-isoprenylcysteine O-methyltransferase Ste14
MIWVMIQAKLEDMDLVERLPVYKVYMQRVPRFLPRIRHSKLQS